MKLAICFKLTILAVLVAATSVAVSNAQTLYNRDAKITVAEKTALSVNGSVENQGTIVNNGQMKVAGAWINSGMYQPGTGQITFNSISKTVPQIIHHNGQTFTTVMLSGGSKKVLLSDLVITNGIHFDRGIVEAAGDARLIFGDRMQISGASDSSHVHGIVYQKGSGYKLFPLGNGVKYLPVELTDVEDPASMVGVQSLEFANVTLSKPSSLASISDKRYWYIDVASGSMPNSTIVLPLRDESAFADPERVVVAESASLTDDFTSIGRTVNENARETGRIESAFSVTKPFVALASTARELELIVYNAVSKSPGYDNRYVRIENIELFPENTFSVFNRWGDKIFQVENYDNDQNVFRGRENINSDAELVSGTYFYVLDIPGQESLRGFIAVKN